MPNFDSIFRIVAALVAFSALLAVGLAALNSFTAVPLAEQLVLAFTESFKNGLAAMVGLLVGHASK